MKWKIQKVEMGTVYSNGGVKIGEIDKNGWQGIHFDVKKAHYWRPHKETK